MLIIFFTVAATNSVSQEASVRNCQPIAELSLALTVKIKLGW